MAKYSPNLGKLEFDPVFYSNAYPEVGAKNLQNEKARELMCLFHYIEYGIYEQRFPNILQRLQYDIFKRRMPVNVLNPWTYYIRYPDIQALIWNKYANAALDYQLRPLDGATSHVRYEIIKHWVYHGKAENRLIN